MFSRHRVHESWPHADGDSSCGESDDDMGLDAGDDSDSEFENLPPTPTPGLASTRVSDHVLGVDNLYILLTIGKVLRSTTDIQSRSRVPLPSPTALGAISLPSVLWNESWQPTIRGVRFTTFEQDAVYQAATSGTPINTIVYRGESADELLRAVGLCVDQGDFTSVLSDDQSVVMFVSALLPSICCPHFFRQICPLVLVKSYPRVREFSERSITSPFRRPWRLDDSG